ncbi:MAG: tyrosine recombinase XerD [Bacteroidales bacterium]|nr:tyrosine recombinase XerD [Bacteroidales bacterium]
MENEKFLKKVGALENFTYYLKVERSMSPNTVAAYSSDLASFLQWFGADPATADSDSVAGFLASVKVSGRSQARMQSSLRSFFSWMVMEGEMDINPCDALDSPKLGRYLPSVLSVEEVEAIIDSVDVSCFSGVRDRAILEILYGCGLRVSEASSIRISDIWFGDSFVRIVGKGNKERIVPLGEEAADAVRAYLQIRPQPASAEFDDTLFLNRRGGRLSRISIFKMVRKQALAAGVTKDISPHTFRHSFATHMIENGADLRIVQEMLGHESILTTEIYTHIDTSTWQRSVLEHHPEK